MIKNEICHLEQRQPSDEEIYSLPHVVMTSDRVWGPTIYNNTASICSNSTMVTNPDALQPSLAHLSPVTIDKSLLNLKIIFPNNPKCYISPQTADQF